MNTLPEDFTCYLVRQISRGQIEAGLETRPLRELPAGDVLIKVQRSGLNYKDAMAATGHPGIVRKFPHVPGIDAAGVVAASESLDFKPGDLVLATGHELGVERWGGWGEYVRVPAEWVLPIPDGLNAEETMALGTAGFTAAQSVKALQQHGVTPDRGEVLVTGATGGVASLSICILSQLGYSVVAVTGKQDRHNWLKSLGASQVVDRTELVAEPKKPLRSAHYAGAIDTVGGDVLAGVLKMIQHRGTVACCGVAGGADLSTTVYPFILRGITLCGIDSAWCPDHLRPEIWSNLAGLWKPRQLASLVNRVPLKQIGDVARKMLAGETTGRTVIEIA